MIQKPANQTYTSTANFEPIDVSAGEQLEFVQTVVAQRPDVAEAAWDSYLTGSQEQDKELLGVFTVEPKSMLLKFIARNQQWIFFSLMFAGMIGLICFTSSFDSGRTESTTIATCITIACLITLMKFIWDKMSCKLEVFDSGFRFQKSLNSKVGRQEIRWKDIDPMGSHVLIEPQSDLADMESRRVTISYRLKSFSNTDKSRKLFLLVEKEQLSVIEFIDAILRR